MFRFHQLGADVHSRPDKVTAKILGAYTKAKACLLGTAELLGVSERQLRRWIVELDLMPKLKRLEARSKREGWHHDRNRKGGRPRTPCRCADRSGLDAETGFCGDCHRPVRDGDGRPA